MAIAIKSELERIVINAGYKENLTAKELAELKGIGADNSIEIEVSGFVFFIYADHDVNAPWGKGKLFVHLFEKDSAFENTIDFQKQTVDIENMIMHIKKELKKVAKKILQVQ